MFWDGNERQMTKFCKVIFQAIAILLYNLIVVKRMRDYVIVIDVR